MVITFEEEKQNPLKKIGIAAFAVVLISAAGFFGYQYFMGLNKRVIEPALTKININWSILKDKRIGELEVFPEVAPFSGDAGKANPFN
jgi:hypothetical protein